MKKHTTLKSKFNSAFSLVELLVVIAVIAVIAAIAIPNITGTREAAQEAQRSYDQASVDRVVSQARAAGASDANVTTLLSSGTVTFTPAGLTNSVTFTTGITNASVTP
jgi:prepilin-type N-terminal cleavage/methylation domain-containing protein